VLASAGASAGGSLRTSAPGAAIATLTALALALAWRGRTRRVLQLDPATDVTQLLLGAMRRPDAFRTAPAVFHHPLLPTLGGGRVTLAHAWTRASERRLYSARAAASPLAAAALQAGLLVLDASQAEAAAVGAALGATDLDQWQAMLQRRLGVPLVDALNQHLSEAHEDWQVCAIADGPPEPAVLELPLRREPARRVVVNLATPWLAAAIADHAQRPARAVFCACERLTGALQVPAARRGRLLAPLAQRALIEAAA
jgi:hypothetical protein